MKKPKFVTQNHQPCFYTVYMGRVILCVYFYSYY